MGRVVTVPSRARRYPAGDGGARALSHRPALGWGCGAVVLEIAKNKMEEERCVFPWEVKTVSFSVFFDTVNFDWFSQ